MLDSFTFTGLEIFVIILAFVIGYFVLRTFRKDTLADRKRQEIEVKRAAIIAKRKAAAKAQADSANTQD